MGYIEEYFGKKPQLIEAADIDNFIQRGLEECLTLDYKDIRFYTQYDDLSKHVSAFTNSDGGLLILGVSEKKHYPDKITWGDSNHSRENLENHLLGKIRPKIEGLRIFPIRKAKKSSEVIFLIDVPKSENPPHMAADKRYYLRYNFQKQPMEHYQVADLFGRRLRPILRLEYKWDVRKSGVIGGVKRFRFSVHVFIKNIGRRMARFPCITVSEPIGEYIRRDLKFNNNRIFPEIGSPGPEWKKRYAGGSDTVIYPNDVVFGVDISNDMPEDHSDFPDFIIRIGLFADNFEGHQEEILIPGDQINTAFQQAVKKELEERSGSERSGSNPK